MTDPTPAAAPATKPELKQISNYVGVAVALIGNLLPYVTPGLLLAVGVPPGAAQIASTLIGAALVAYREKQPVSPTTTQEPTK